MGNSSRESLFGSLLAFLCLGLTSAVYAFDDPPSPAGRPGNSASPSVLTGEIARQVEYWSAHCGKREAARRNIEASRCWWYAAEELNRYVSGGQPVTDEVRELRRDWLWRGVRLSRQLLEPKRSAAVEPPTAPLAGLICPRSRCGFMRVDFVGLWYGMPRCHASGPCASGHRACGRCACGEAHPITQESGSDPQGQQEENCSGRKCGGEGGTGEESPQEGDFQTSRGTHCASCAAIDSREKDELCVSAEQAMCRPPFAARTWWPGDEARSTLMLL